MDLTEQIIKHRTKQNKAKHNLTLWVHHAITWTNLTLIINKKCSWASFVTCIRRLHFWNYNRITREPMSLNQTSPVYVWAIYALQDTISLIMVMVATVVCAMVSNWYIYSPQAAPLLDHISSACHHYRHLSYRQQIFYVSLEWYL